MTAQSLTERLVTNKKQRSYHSQLLARLIVALVATGFSSNLAYADQKTPDHKYTAIVTRTGTEGSSTDLESLVLQEIAKSMQRAAMRAFARTIDGTALGSTKKLQSLNPVGLVASFLHDYDLAMDQAIRDPRKDSVRNSIYIADCSFRCTWKLHGSNFRCENSETVATTEGQRGNSLPAVLDPPSADLRVKKCTASIQAAERAINGPRGGRHMGGGLSQHIENLNHHQGSLAIELYLVPFDLELPAPPPGSLAETAKRLGTGIFGSLLSTAAAADIGDSPRQDLLWYYDHADSITYTDGSSREAARIREANRQLFERKYRPTKLDGRPLYGRVLVSYARGHVTTDAVVTLTPPHLQIKKDIFLSDEEIRRSADPSLELIQPQAVAYTPSKYSHGSLNGVPKTNAIRLRLTRSYTASKPNVDANAGLYLEFGEILTRDQRDISFCMRNCFASHFREYAKTSLGPLPEILQSSTYPKIFLRLVRSALPKFAGVEGWGWLAKFLGDIAKSGPLWEMQVLVQRLAVVVQPHRITVDPGRSFLTVLIHDPGTDVRTTLSTVGNYVDGLHPTLTWLGFDTLLIPQDTFTTQIAPQLYSRIEDAINKSVFSEEKAAEIGKAEEAIRSHIESLNSLFFH